MEVGGDIRLGSALFTLVEPHRGHEVAYNRWYERDHFYAGCMVGPWLYAGRRWVATRDEKALRTGSRPDLFGPDDPGTYLAVYFVIAGKHDEHFGWGLEQVQWLHANDRMFPERDHVHTLLYDRPWTVSRDDDGVPPELALDHPYTALVAQVLDADDDSSVRTWLEAHRADTPALGQTVAFRPVPLAVDAPVAQVGLDDIDRRVLLLRFADGSIADAARQAAGVADAPGVELLWSSPFRPTIPGTDTYTDVLW